MSNDPATLAVAERVRTACLRAALQAHEQAGISGLCAEGRWELAMDALASLDLRHALESMPTAPAVILATTIAALGD